jgi:low temperature requirement protein LtrA
MWWIYFDQPVERLLVQARRAFSARDEAQSFIWGYGHYFVFASAAAVGVGLAVAVDQAVDHSALTDLEAAFVLTCSVALYLVTIWVLHWRHKAPGWFRVLACPITAAVVLAASWSSEPVLLSGLALVGLVAASLIHPSEVPVPEHEADAELASDRAR